MGIVGGRCRGAGPSPRDCMDEAGRPSQVRSSTPPARSLGLGWCGRAGLRRNPTVGSVYGHRGLAFGASGHRSLALSPVASCSRARPTPGAQCERGLVHMDWSRSIQGCEISIARGSDSPASTTLLPDAAVHSPCRFAPVTGTPSWTGSYNGSPVRMTNP